MKLAILFLVFVLSGCAGNLIGYKSGEHITITRVADCTQSSPSYMECHMDGNLMVIDGRKMYWDKVVFEPSLFHPEGPGYDFCRELNLLCKKGE